MFNLAFKPGYNLIKKYNITGNSCYNGIIFIYFLYFKLLVLINILSTLGIYYFILIL